MIPIVKVDEEGKDKRKNKTLHWKEARLCLFHEAGSTTLTFGATFSGTVADAGKQPVWNETEYGEPWDKIARIPVALCGRFAAWRFIG